MTGGGSGMGKAIVELEVTDSDSGLSLVRRVLQELGVAQSTAINQYEPVRSIHQVYAAEPFNPVRGI